MNVYDFDKTIYDGDSSIDFIIYTYKKYPKILFKNALFHLFLIIKMKTTNKDITQFKSKYFSFLKDIPNVEEHIDSFSEAYTHKIKQWYIGIHKNDDLIISASPLFLLKSLTSRLDIQNIIATNMDKRTGVIKGRNCKGKEKVHRFQQKYKNRSIENFYTDNYSDLPMMKISKNSYIVSKNTVSSIDPRKIIS